MSGPYGVLATGFHGDLDTRQVEVGLGDQQRRLLVDVTGDPDEVEVGPGVRVDRGVDLGGVDVEQGGQPLDDLRTQLLGQVGRPDLDRERGDVGHQHATEPVVDQATRRWDRLENGTVVAPRAWRTVRRQ